MRCSYRIAGGRIVDPSRGMDAVGDLCIRNARIVEPAPGETVEAEETIDAAGRLVAPGLIDFHMHMNRGHGDHGAHPDLAGIPNCVTSAVDPGSTGTANFDGFLRDVVRAAELTVKSFLHVSPIGVTTIRHPECPNPELWDIPLLERLFELHYPDDIMGLKLRVGRPINSGYGRAALKNALDLAERLGAPLCLHVVDPEEPYAEILSRLRKGDILCHCFQNQGASIVENGKVIAAAREARDRGVLFDAAPARRNYSFATLTDALGDGFPPDLIGTDLVAQSVYTRQLFSLPYVLSGFIAAGMPLADALGAVTETPAKCMGMAGKIGTLAPGALADVAILDVREKPIVFNDQFGNSVTGEKLLVPLATFKTGRCLFMRADFAF